MATTGGHFIASRETKETTRNGDLSSGPSGNFEVWFGLQSRAFFMPGCVLVGIEQSIADPRLIWDLQATQGACWLLLDKISRLFP